MPIKPTGSETEQEFISRCMSEEKESFPDTSQRYAVCKSKWDNSMKTQDFETEIFVLKPSKNENRGKYLERCSKNNRMRLQYPNMRERLNSCLHGFNSFYKYWNKLEEFAGIPSDSALGECIAREKAKGADYRTAYASCSTKVVNQPTGGTNPSVAPASSVSLSEDDNLIEEPVLLADYPWDDCIADQLDKGYDEESANKICGYIKAKNA